MAANFRILVHRNASSLHLKLVGDFDGSSAHELINIIDENLNRCGKIFVHTSGLRKIYDFGRNIFTKRLPMNRNLLPKLIFTGESSGEIAPDGSKRPVR